MAYLQEIKHQMRQLGHLFGVDRDRPVDVSPNEATQDLVLDMLLKCHQHGLQKIRQRLEKHKAGFDAYMAEVRQNPGTVDGVLHDELCDLENGLNLVARTFKEQRPDVEIAKLIVWYASLLAKYLKDGSSELRLLEGLDQHFATPVGGFTMCCFLEELFTHHTAVMNLVSLSASVRFRPLIESNLTIVLVPGEHHAVSFPVRGPAVDATLTAFDKTALSRMHDNVETIAKEPWSGTQHDNFTFQSYVHAECALIAYLHRHKLRAYPYIGVSKLACYSCSRYIHTYNAAGKELDGFHECFFTRGTRGEICLPWVSPELGTDQDKMVQGKMIEEIKQDMEALLGRDAARRAGPGSTGIPETEKPAPAHNWASKLKEHVQEIIRGQQV
ncbi:hypothetical protein EWM64_g9874 [Hericium alpestre]|uniref:Uncharacterized protein n=1 Tax=Hericium alpestre TaxID=135208 RepID=A0A4Y9ZKH8_9AGAM|nr:hypothetical protein EWM64_g9874 [Hericium alpestre]